MYTGTYKIAEQVVQITSVFETVHTLCRDYAWDGEADFTVVTNPQDIVFERIKSAREDEVEGIPTRHFTDSYLETLAVYRKIARHMLTCDTLLFHGSAIAVDGEVVLFTAKSGTGKSTHTKLWRETFGDRAVMVNDDKPLLRITQDGVWVCGTPWDGKHRLSTNCMLPLKAICVLERGERNVITPISAQEMLPMLLQQSYRPEEASTTAQLLQVLDKLTKKTSFYRLACNMDLSAAQVAYDGIFGK